MRVDVSSGHRVVWFLTSSCRPCQAVWPRLGPVDVAITPSPSTESRRKVAALAPAGVEVVMSSDAWFRFEAGPAPWRVEILDGRIVGSGPGVAGVRPDRP